MNSKNLTFGETGRNPPNQRGQIDGFTPRMEVDDESHPSTQIHRRNRRKSPQIRRYKIRPKIPLKVTKK
jgi:hypothetical protein